MVASGFGPADEDPLRDLVPSLECSVWSDTGGLVASAMRSVIEICGLLWVCWSSDDE